MQKNKTLATLLIVNCLLLIGTKSAKADVLSIQTLPAYIKTNSFKLSCTSSGGTYQFEVSKNGGAFSTFGTAIDTSVNPCMVQIDSSVVNDQTNYTFRVGDKSTSTFYDASGPSPISGYYKEAVSENTNKLHWKNPSDTDFDKVVIYKGEVVDFSADSSHEIARVSGGPDSDMTYEDHFTPSSKTYYYAIRAIDHAGNSSSLAGDGGINTTFVLGTSTEKKVTVLPKEDKGSILGTEATPSTDESLNAELDTTPGAAKWILTHKKVSLGIVVALFAIAYGLYRFSKKNK